MNDSNTLQHHSSKATKTQELLELIDEIFGIKGSMQDKDGENR